MTLNISSTLSLPLDVVTQSTGIKDGIADLAGLSRTSSSVGQALTELRRNGLVEDHTDGIQAADILFEGRA
jgi:hypothetical protein